MTDRRMMPAEAAWAAARELGALISAQRAAHRQQLRDARNARRRARRAAAPKPARAPKRPAAIDDDAVEDGCRCPVMPMPPCGWCEGGGDIAH
ncbi:hypothetical protein [Rhizomonospora bruguierae]|uniref:hypothetical protein n=1 Tax=Rhizomonospora bruguierae TaxID=1581705 RepID=UPI001BCE49C1|nr:hypothetical protein [Micromonospora sp. NBRC 107566]